MQIAILGYGREGQAALEYWHQAGNQITICDISTNVDVPSYVKSKLGQDYLRGLGAFDLIIRSPGIHPNDIAQANPDIHDIFDKVSSVTNEFFRVSPTANIIGVTGTKGKGTTSTLIAKMLETAGKKVHLGGNIGIPPLELLKHSIGSEDWVVLELSSFQLIDLRYSPHIGVCLMIVPEHLNWHQDMSEYVESKKSIFKHQTQHDIAIYYSKNKWSQEVALVGVSKKIPYMSEPGALVDNTNITIGTTSICHVKDVKLLGHHNLQNVCAAVTAVWQVTQDDSVIRDTIMNFSGLEHRLELVKEVDGVKYYDDSFGTTPETAIVAMQAFTEPKVVILGGSDKGASYEQLADVVTKNNVRSVVLIGETAAAIEASLRSDGYNNIIHGGNTMSTIVSAAKDQTMPGDVVLLSTGCASFGLFQNYKDRGNQFKSVVQSLS